MENKIDDQGALPPPQAAAVPQDVSKRTVMVLLVITILITALGVWTVLDRLDSNTPQQGSVNGYVSFNVLPSDGTTTDQGPSSASDKP